MAMLQFSLSYSIALGIAVSVFYVCPNLQRPRIPSFTFPVALLKLSRLFSRQSSRFSDRYRLSRARLLLDGQTWCSNTIPCRATAYSIWTHYFRVTVS